MTPNMIYQLPDRYTEGVSEIGSELLNRVFDLYAYVDEIDPADDNRLMLHHKLSKSFGCGDDGAFIDALSFDGKYFALYLRGSGDYESVVVTDEAVFECALSFLSKLKRTTNHVAQPDAPLDIFQKGFGGAVLTKVGESVRLVPAEHVSDDGRPLFDDEVYLKAFDRLVRPHYSHHKAMSDGPAFIDNEPMKQAAALALRESIPSEFLPVVVNRIADRASGDPINAWLGVLLLVDGKTYAAGLYHWNASSKHLDWGRSTMFEEIGDGHIHAAALQEATGEMDQPKPAF